MEEEAERRRQPPLKLEPEEEVNHEKSHKDRDREKRGSGRPAEPVPPGPQKQSDDEDVVADEDDYHDAEDSLEAKPQLKPVMRPITTAPSVSSASGNATPNTPGNESPCGIIIPGENTPEVQPPEEHRPKIGLSLKLGESNRRTTTSFSAVSLTNKRLIMNKLGFFPLLQVPPTVPASSALGRGRS